MPLTVSALDVRGNAVACVEVTKSGSRAVLRSAEVCTLSDLPKLDIKGEVVLLAPSTACYRVREELTQDIQVPDPIRYGQLTASTSQRPGGRVQAAVVEQRDRAVSVGLVNVDVVDETAQKVRDAIGVRVGVVDPIAAWLALSASLDKPLPDVLIDDWEDPSSLISIDHELNWIHSEIEVIPSGAIDKRSSAMTTLVSSLIARREIHSIGLIGRVAKEPDYVVGALAAVVRTIEPLWNTHVPPWYPALGAALVTLRTAEFRDYHEVLRA